MRRRLDAFPVVEALLYDLRVGDNERDETRNDTVDDCEVSTVVGEEISVSELVQREKL